MLVHMAFLQRTLLPFALTIVPFALSQQPVTIQRSTGENGMPSSGGYKPPALSLTQLLESNRTLNEAQITFARTRDSAAFRSTVFQAAQSGDLGAELLLAEQYIPEQCPSEPNQDVPHCGKGGNESPPVIFRENPLEIPASYEDAARWLEKASAQGSGEASEVLAQLITRMQTNGHGTNYTAADSARLHALARSQGFDVEPISVTCYKIVPGGNGVTVAGTPRLGSGEPPSEPFTHSELEALSMAGISGSLQHEGGAGGGDSAILTRPEGPVAHVRIILDHDPGSEVQLPMPAHHDVIYVQRGDNFLAFPETGKVLPRFVSIESQKESVPQISVYVQLIGGGQIGGFCAHFP